MSKIENLNKAFSGMVARTDNFSEAQQALVTRCDTIDIRLGMLERTSSPQVNLDRLQSNTLDNNTAKRIDRIEYANRDFEIIITGIPNVVRENILDTIHLTALSINTPVCSFWYSTCDAHQE